MTIFSIFILSLFSVFTLNASILAVEQSFPIRSGTNHLILGKLKLGITAPVNQTRTYPINYYLPLGSTPTGIVLGIRTLQI